jgi:1-acyl-sn-glycerol-3-phosphate acyltransferase
MLPSISPSLLKWFKRYLRYWYMPWHLHAVRISRRGGLPAIPDGPLILVTNHPSWWDPIVLILLTDLLPERRHFAPIDAAALNRYRFFGKLGMFGVEPGKARSFLRTGMAILETPGTALWITAQGRFADVRERPVRLQGGVGYLAARRGQVLPVALEYPFWHERAPEALVRFGDLLPMPATTAEIAGALERTQDALAAEAQQQRPELFENYIAGKVGVGLAYDAWRRLRERGMYAAEHATLIRRRPA